MAIEAKEARGNDALPFTMSGKRTKETATTKAFVSTKASSQSILCDNMSRKMNWNP